MIELKNNVLIGVILIVLFGLIALGVWEVTKNSSVSNMMSESPGRGQEGVKVDVTDNTGQATAQPIKTDGSYTVMNNNEKGIDVSVESKTPFKMTFPTSLSNPVTITLGDNKTIEIIQKDGAEYSTGVKENTVETTENAKLLSIIEKDPTLSTYVSTDKKKTVFYSYQKTEGDQKQWLFKNWILYNTQTNNRETVSYEMRNALVNIDALGNANVFFDDKTAIGNRTPDFSIPRPYILDKDAKKTDLMWTYDAVSHTLAVSFSALASSYPIALDPSVLKTDTVIATFSGKTICMQYSCGTPTVPDAPTIGTATQTGTTTATVAFTAPARNGRATITTYTAYPSSGGGSGTLSQAGSGTISVTGLTTDTTYTFTVTATNSVGEGPASSASNSILTQIISSYIATPASTPAAFGDAFEGGFYAGMIWNELIESATSTTIGTGSKTFTVSSGAAYAYAGQTLEVRSRADPANKMIGTVTGANLTTLIVNVTSVGGSGTFTDWSIMSKYRIIIAPKASGENSSIAYKNSQSGAPAVCGTLTEGKKCTDAMVAADTSTVYPAAWWCHNLSIGGYADWYLPARDELELCLRNLKPGTGNNWIDPRDTSSVSGMILGAYGDSDTGNAHNLNSSPIGATCTLTVPGQVAAGKNFRTGESEAFPAEAVIHSSSMSGWSGFNWHQQTQTVSMLVQWGSLVTTAHTIRAVRRSII